MFHVFILIILMLHFYTIFILWQKLQYYKIWLSVTLFHAGLYFIVKVMQYSRLSVSQWSYMLRLIRYLMIYLKIWKMIDSNKWQMLAIEIYEHKWIVHILLGSPLWHWFVNGWKYDIHFVKYIGNQCAFSWIFIPKPFAPMIDSRLYNKWRGEIYT